MNKLNNLLKYLENNLDGEHIEKIERTYKSNIDFQKQEKIPIKIDYPIDEFQPFPKVEAEKSFEKMMFNELIGCVPSAQIKDGSLPMIRANYGVGIMPSLFGLQTKILNNDLPWVIHLENEKEIERLVQVGLPDLNCGFGSRVIETHEFYNDKLSKYPICQKYIKITHPDMQGPLDIAHLIWGGEIYYAMYDSPELVKSLMRLITDTYIQFMKKVKLGINDEVKECIYHWGMMYPGKILVRNDSAVNLSSDMYLEFVQGHDEYLFSELGGGSLHFCGRADQIVFDMMRTKGSLGINFGYMENKEFGFTYLDYIKAECDKLKMPVVGYFLTIDEIKQMNMEKFGEGLTVWSKAKSMEEAKQILRFSNVLGD